MFTFWQTLERYLCSCRILYTVESFFLPSLSLSFSLKHSGCQRNRALRANCIPLLSLCLSFHSFCFCLSPGSVSTAARLLHQNMNRHLSHTPLPTNLPPPSHIATPTPLYPHNAPSITRALHLAVSLGKSVSCSANISQPCKRLRCVCLFFFFFFFFFILYFILGSAVLSPQ